MIIPFSWVFAILLITPMFIVKDVLKNKDGNFCAYVFPKEWMGRAYTTTWNVVFFLPLALMIVLYARVVRALWFHGNDDNELTHQQKVSVTYNVYGSPNTGADLRGWIRWLNPQFGKAKTKQTFTLRIGNSL